MLGMGEKETGWSEEKDWLREISRAQAPDQQAVSVHGDLAQILHLDSLLMTIQLGQGFILSTKPVSLYTMWLFSCVCVSMEWGGLQEQQHIG